MTQKIKQLLSTSTTFKYKAQEDFLEIQHPAITMPGIHKKIINYAKNKENTTYNGKKKCQPIKTNPDMTEVTLKKLL